MKEAVVAALPEMLLVFAVSTVLVVFGIREPAVEQQPAARQPVVQQPVAVKYVYECTTSLEWLVARMNELKSEEIHIVSIPTMVSADRVISSPFCLVYSK